MQFSTKMSFSVKNVTINKSNQFPILYQTRYCDQESFSIAVFDAENNRKHDKPFLLRNFDTKVYLPSLPRHQYGCEAIGSGSSIYLLDQYKVGKTCSVMLYFFQLTFGQVYLH